jgi:hypothetical protein
MSSKIESLDMLCVRKNGSRLQVMVLVMSITLSVATAAQTGSAAPRQPAWGTSESTAQQQPFETAVGEVSTHGVFVGGAVWKWWSGAAQPRHGKHRHQRSADSGESGVHLLGSDYERPGTGSR